MWDVEYAYIEPWLDDQDDATVASIFAFDPERKAIMLLGGDKAKGKNGKAKWSGWYKRAIPKAEKVYQEHLIQLRQIQMAKETEVNHG